MSNFLLPFGIPTSADFVAAAGTAGLPGAAFAATGGVDFAAAAGGADFVCAADFAGATAFAGTVAFTATVAFAGTAGFFDGATLAALATCFASCFVGAAAAFAVAAALAGTAALVATAFAVTGLTSGVFVAVDRDGEETRPAPFAAARDVPLRARLVKASPRGGGRRSTAGP